MFKSFMNFGRRPNLGIIEALYAGIVASARQPVFYAAWEVPDTPLGRFEMMSLHMFLFLERVRGGSAALSDVAQEMTDEFFKDVEHSLRELGIGDMGVPKRMKKLARMFYGRAEAYREAMAAEDDGALVAALARNVWPGRADWPQGRHVAAYARQALAHLSAVPEEELLAGRISFPEARS